MDTICTVCQSLRPNLPERPGPTEMVVGQQVHRSCANEVRFLLANWDVNLTGGVYRWNLSGHVVPDDTMILAVRFGLASPDYVETTAAASRIETQMALEAYRRQARRPSAEQMAEMRNAFGPDAHVVDVITGQRLL